MRIGSCIDYSSHRHPRLDCSTALGSWHIASFVFVSFLAQIVLPNGSSIPDLSRSLYQSTMYRVLRFRKMHSTGN
jgi:hypothetical protein